MLIFTAFSKFRFILRVFTSAVVTKQTCALPKTVVYHSPLANKCIHAYAV